MKKIIFTGLGITLPILAISLSSYGQAPKKELAFTKNSSSTETSVLKAADNTLNRSNVTSKARKSFVASYKGVSDEKWYNVSSDLVARFTRDGIGYQVYYDKKGNWTNTIRTYDESKLPTDVRQPVRSTYYDYNINLVQEVQTPLSPITYIIQLIGKSEIISLRMCEGEMTVLKTLQKSE
jgi:hypothetical protein